MAWLFLFTAIVFEVAGTICMKFSEGLSKPLPSVLIFVFYAVAFALMTLALRKIDLSVAYTIWAGTGTALVALIGVFYFGDMVTALRVVSILAVLAGVVGLRLSMP